MCYSPEVKLIKLIRKVETCIHEPENKTLT